MRFDENRTGSPDGEMRKTDHLRFTVKGNDYALDPSIVRTVSDPLPITQVPLAPDAVKGVSNLRGEVSTVIDAGILLEKGTVEEGKIIFIMVKGEMMGLLVNRVYGIEPVDHDVVLSEPYLAELLGEHVYNVE